MQPFEERHVWNLLESYARKNTLVSNQIESFNDFVTFGMQEIVNQESTIALPNYTAKFGQITLAPPQVIEEDRSLRSSYPMDARRRDLNYDSAILCNIEETFYGDETITKTHNRIMIGRMPIMLRSCMCNLTKLTEEEILKYGECPNDPGGYFIIKGNERVLVGQMRAVYNQVFVLKQKPGGKYNFVAETRSMSDETGHSILLQAKIGNDDRTIDFSLPYIKEPIPVGVVFKALGYDDQEISNLIGIDNIKQASKYLKYITRDSAFCKTKEEALTHISQFAMHIVEDKKKIDYAKQIVESETLPHLGISGTISEQACFLGRMVRRLIMTNIGLRSEDDRDNYANKRVECAGHLMYEIFRNLFKKYILFIKTQLEKRKQTPDIIPIISRFKDITKGLHKCIATGNWGVQKNASYVRTGVSQVLDRMTYCASLSHLRRVIIPMGKEGKNTAMRQIHGSSFGYVCPCETPEGQKIGVVLNFALLARVTRKIPKVDVRAVLETCEHIIPVEEMKLCDIKNYAMIFLNGGVVGFSRDPEETVQEIKFKRQQGLIEKDVSVSYDVVDNDIRIFCDEGRFIRPLLTLTDNKLNIQGADRYKWNSLIRKGVIQYVDAAEIENCVIAMTPSDLKIQVNDFCEIHPSVMLGVMASMIPFPDHSQSPRNCYQCLWVEEKVLMADGTKKRIADVKVGDSIITVDPNTCKQSVTKVINQYVRGTDKKIVKVSTVTGREVVCTDDHPILTISGWKKAGDLKEEDRVCVFPTQKIEITEPSTVHSIMSNLVVKNVKESLVKKHEQKLRDLGLIPLLTNNPKLPILARMLGYLLTDGSAIIRAPDSTPHVGFTFGSKIGCEEFLEDIKILGFDCNKVQFTESDTWGCGYQICYENAFASLLISLSGNYVGKRTVIDSVPIPEWIMNGTWLVKREFLSGFQGGDGCKIRCNVSKKNKTNYVLNYTTQTKKKENVESLENVMNQLKSLFQEFGIVCSIPIVKKSAHGNDRFTVSLPFSNTQENLVKYFEIIGWRYDNFKLRDSLPVYEYINFVRALQKNVQLERDLVLETRLSSTNNISVAKKLKIPESTVNTHIRSYREGRKPRIPNNSMTYTEWLTKIEMKENAVFVHVASVTPMDNVAIADITTASECHSFITGEGICVHNSSMGKQALGLPAISYNLRTDTLLHVLHYPQRPLVCTKSAEIFKINDMPSGVNATVAIISAGFKRLNLLSQNTQQVYTQ
jgi:DNA-directed RNA polymerase beta subunit